MSTKKQQMGDDAEASRLIAKISKERARTAPVICVLDVNPTEQKKCFLGSYDKNSGLRGFAVELTPEPNPKDSVVTRIVNSAGGGKRELHMHVANYSNKPVTAIVREL